MSDKWISPDKFRDRVFLICTFDYKNVYTAERDGGIWFYENSGEAPKPKGCMPLPEPPSE